MTQLPLFEPSHAEASGLAPAARRTDPITSHEAADNYRSTGHAASDGEAIYRALAGSRDGMTAGEIARALGQGWNNVRVSRRTPELEQLGRIRRGEPRICSVRKSKMVTWNRVLLENER